jgi:hypothetical protein
MLRIYQSTFPLYNTLLIELIATFFHYPLISYGYHGQEISVFLDSAELIPLDVQENHQ